MLDLLPTGMRNADILGAWAAIAARAEQKAWQPAPKAPARP